ncbi:MAG TPA: hypothetical protein VFZ58_06040 [Candidatus Saccharimonadales bacterium]
MAVASGGLSSVGLSELVGTPGRWLLLRSRRHTVQLQGDSFEKLALVVVLTYIAKL